MEYTTDRGSHIAPHFDDFWIWGDRIAGINLLEDTVLTFYRELEYTNIEIDIKIPRRSLYLIHNVSRRLWMHGLKADNINHRRLVCTLREVGEEWGKENPELLKEVLNYI